MRIIRPLVIIGTCGALLVACKSKEQAQKEAADSPTPAQILANKPRTHGKLTKPVELTTPVNQEWVKTGQEEYELKCAACHRLDDTKIVGPGWKGVTERRTPEWIMNMIVNTDEMLDNDPEAQEMLEECLVRMPNQNLSEDDARHVLEFMRANDGVQ